MLRRKSVVSLPVIAASALGVGLYWQWLNLAPDIQISTRTTSSPSAYAALNAATKLERDGYRVMTWHVNSGSKDDRACTAKEKDALVVDNMPALTAVRAALRVPFDCSPVRSVHTAMPDFAKYRNLVRLFPLEADVLSARGDNAGAMSSCLDAVDLGVKIPRGGILINALNGYTCEAIGEKPMWGLIDKLDAAEALVAAQRLGSLTEQRVPYAETLQEEKHYGQAILAEAFHDKSTFAACPELRLISRQDHDDEDTHDLTTAKETIHSYRALLTHSKQQIVANYSAMMDAYIERAQRPIQMSANPIRASDDGFNQMLSPAWSEGNVKEAVIRMKSGLLTDALALRAFKMRHGEYPAALADLVTDGTLRHLPDDPYATSSGTPFGYRRVTADKYILYSVWADGVDDGGVPVALSDSDTHYRTWPESGDKGDWVVGVNIGKLEIVPASN